MDPNKNPWLVRFFRVLGASVILYGLVFGGIFAAASGYVLYRYILPSWQRYLSAGFSERESVTVLIIFSAVALLVFLAGIVIIVNSLRMWPAILLGSENLATPRQLPFASRTLPSSPVKPRGRIFRVRTKNLVQALQLPDGSVRYSSRSMYQIVFRIALVFSLFWNGVVIVGVHSMLGHSVLSVIQLLLMLPFAIIGIGLIAGTVYVWMISRHPAIEITLSPGSLRLGETSSLEWKVVGNPNRMVDLTILLECVERATEGSGDDETTRKRTFFRSILAEQSISVAFPQGRATVCPPQEFVPSFESDHHEISWQLVVRGKAADWPGLFLVFPIQVAP